LLEWLSGENDFGVKVAASQEKFGKQEARICRMKPWRCFVTRSRTSLLEQFSC